MENDFTGLRFNVDEPADAEEFAWGEMLIRGWAMSGDEPVSIAARIGESSWAPVEMGKLRPDVAKAHPANPSALRSGFARRFDIRDLPPGEYQVGIRLLSGERIEGEVQRTIRICDSSNLKRNTSAYSPDGYVRIKMEEPTGESLILNGSVLRVGGWAVAKSGVQRIEIWIDGEGPQTVHYGMMREDIGTIYDEFPGASHAGFLWASHIGHLHPGRHKIRLVCMAKCGRSLELDSTFEIDRRNEYEFWSDLNEHGTEELLQLFEGLSGLAYAPKISIVTPVFQTREDFLRRCIDSVKRQVYPNWELILVDDHSDRPRLTALLEKFVEDDQRIRRTELPSNLGIAGATNAGLALAHGEFVGLLDHDDEISPDALLHVVETLNLDRSIDVLYSDEDKIDECGRRKDPFFKPDWSPELLLSMNYICHFLVFRRSLLEKTGGLRLGFDGSQDYDLILRLSEHTPNIRRIPKVLYHWRTHEESTAASVDKKPQASDAGRRAIQEHLDRLGVKAEVREIGPGRYRPQLEITDRPEIAIIIPTGGSPTLKAALESILETSTYSNYKIFVVDNSKDRRVLEILEPLQDKSSRISLIDCRGLPFNFSLLCNRAAASSDAPYVLFLNDDTSVITPDWLETMLEHAMKPQIGAVGALLLFPNGTIQHAGVVTGLFEVAGHPFRGMPEKPYYFDFTHVVRNCSAVTGACLMMRRDVFERQGGFDEENLPTCFQDVDLCLKVLEEGLRVVYTPFAKLFHYESFSKRAIADLPELGYMKRRWRGYISDDPYYSPNISRIADDYSYRYDSLFLETGLILTNGKASGGGNSLSRRTPAARKLSRFGAVDFYSPALGSIPSEGGSEPPVMFWHAPRAEKVQVRVGSPMGKLLAEGSESGSAATGSWFQNGTVFYLVDVSGGEPASPERVLSVLQI